MKEDGANLKAAKGLTKVIAVVIILAVAGFGDVMYIQAMSSKFPSGGPLLVMCYVGAFTSFLAVMYLLIGKSMAFRPGAQMIGAWVVFVAELLIIALNILLVFTSHATGLMGAWAYISPATPVMHMLGVALLYFLDPDLALKHHAMEMHERMQKSEREVEELTHQARIDLRKKQVEHVSKSLEEAVNSPESLSYIQQFGYKINMELLTELTGMSSATFRTPVSPALPAPGTPPAISHRSMALPPVGTGGSETDEWAANEEWLNQVNDRVASERARRMQEEEAARGDGGSKEAFDLEGVDLGRVSSLVDAAAAQGYDLDRLEKFLGLDASTYGPVTYHERLRRLAEGAANKGYSLDQVERFLGIFEGGEDAKKK